MRIHSKYFSPDIHKVYSIEALIYDDEYVYTKIVRGVYGPKQAAIISYNQLFHYTNKYGYYSITFTTRIW